MVGRYTAGRPNRAVNWLIHFDIRPDNTVIVTVEDGCGEFAFESMSTYAWEAVSEDEIRIHTLDGGWINGTYKIAVTPGHTCDQLLVEFFTPEVSLYQYAIDRGEQCLNLYAGVCFSSWCDESPAPCQDAETSG